MARELSRVSGSLQSETGKNGGDDVLRILEWLAPFVRDTLLRGIELGIEISKPDAAEDIARPSRPVAPDRERHQQAYAEDAAPDRAAPVSIKEAMASRLRQDNSPETVDEDGEERLAPWLLQGQVTLLASPFNSFADVQDFLAQLTRVPGIVEARPKRFGRGRLYVSLVTELHESEAVADAIASALISYQPQVRSIQAGLIEMHVQPPAA